MAEGFDPSKYLGAVGGKDYLEVKWRLVWLRERHPDAIIETECLVDTDQFARFKATVTIPGGGAASGHGSETMGDFRDFYEKAETKAIGRALAALGFGTQFSAHEFGGEGEGNRPVDSPVASRANGSGGTVTPMARAGLEPTEKQIKMLWAIARGKGMSDDDLHAFAGVETLDDLDRRQVSELIDRLQKADAVTPVVRETGEIVSWTLFWEQARGLGYTDKAAVEAVIGPLGGNPQHALNRLLGTNPREHQRPIAS